MKFTRMNVTKTGASRARVCVYIHTYQVMPSSCGFSKSHICIQLRPLRYLRHLLKDVGTQSTELG
jgi:hypothetical protein